MNRHEEFFPRPPRKPFEPTPWLVVAIVLLAVTVTSLIDSCGSW